MHTSNVGQPGFVVGSEPIPLTLEETEAVYGGGPMAAGAVAGFVVVGGALAVGAAAGVVIGAGAVIAYNAVTDAPPADDKKPVPAPRP